MLGTARSGVTNRVKIFKVGVNSCKKLDVQSNNLCPNFKFAYVILQEY